jgi:hypothetical protein
MRRVLLYHDLLLFLKKDPENTQIFIRPYLKHVPPYHLSPITYSLSSSAPPKKAHQYRRGLSEKGRGTACRAHLANNPGVLYVYQ